MLRRPHFAALAHDVGCRTRREGLRAVARTVADGTFARHDRHVLLKPLDSVAPIAFEPTLSVRELRPAALRELAELNRRHCDTRADRRFADNLERRYHGFTAHADGEIAGHYWWTDVTSDPHPHLARLGIRLGARDVYGFDFFLEERHRGEGRAVEFLFQVETRLRELGYARLWGYVDGANTAARWLYSMRGYQVAHTLRRRRGALR